jgi:hypothetical protein
MRPSTYVHVLFHGYCCSNQMTIRIEVITKATNSLYGTNIKIIFSHIICAGRSCSFLMYASIIGDQMGEMSKLG